MVLYKLGLFCFVLVDNSSFCHFMIDLVHSGIVWLIFCIKFGGSFDRSGQRPMQSQHVCHMALSFWHHCLSSSLDSDTWNMFDYRYFIPYTYVPMYHIEA